MVGKDLKRLMMMVLAGVLLVQVFKCQVVDFSWKRFQKDILQKQKEYKTEISDTEIKDFIRLWPEFRQLQLEDRVDASYQVENDDNELNMQTKIWFLYHKWDARRFFYVRQRIEYLLQAIEVKQKAEALIEDLSERNDSISKDMIELQKKRLEADVISQDEISLIVKYKEKLAEILKD